MPEDEKQLATLSQKVGDLTVEVKTYAGLVANHVTRQDAINNQVNDKLDRHEGKLEKVTQWQAIKDATFPEHPVSREDVEQDLADIRDSVDTNGRKIDEQGRRIAWVLGIGGGLYLAIEVATKFWGMFH